MMKINPAKLLALVSLLLAIAASTHAFQLNHPVRSRYSRELSLSDVFIRQHKFFVSNDARPRFSPRIRMALDQSIVDKYVLQAEKNTVSAVPTKLAKALKKNSGSIAVALEYRFATERAPQAVGKSLMPNTLGADVKADIRLFSMQMRKEKTSALFIDGSSERGETPSFATRPFQNLLTRSGRPGRPRRVCSRAGHGEGRVSRTNPDRAQLPHRLRAVRRTDRALQRRRENIPRSAPRRVYGRPRCAVGQACGSQPGAAAGEWATVGVGRALPRAGRHRGQAPRGGAGGGSGRGGYRPYQGGGGGAGA